MLCIITMRKVKAGNVHAILCQPQHNILVIGIGTHGTDDLCLFHFNPPLLNVSCVKRSGAGFNMWGSCFREFMERSKPRTIPQVFLLF